MRFINLFIKKIKLLLSMLCKLVVSKSEMINIKKYKHNVFHIKQENIKLIMSTSIVYKVEIPERGGGILFQRM